MPLNLQAEVAYSIHFNAKVRLEAFSIRREEITAIRPFKAFNQPVVVPLALRAVAEVSHIFATKLQLVIDGIVTRLETRFRISDVCFDGGRQAKFIDSSANIIIGIAADGIHLVRNRRKCCLEDDWHNALSICRAS